MENELRMDGKVPKLMFKITEKQFEQIKDKKIEWMTFGGRYLLDVRDENNVTTEKVAVLIFVD